MRCSAYIGGCCEDGTHTFAELGVFERHLEPPAASFLARVLTELASGRNIVVAGLLDSVHSPADDSREFPETGEIYGAAVVRGDLASTLVRGWRPLDNATFLLASGIRPGEILESWLPDIEANVLIEHRLLRLDVEIASRGWMGQTLRLFSMRDRREIHGVLTDVALRTGFQIDWQPKPIVGPSGLEPGRRGILSTLAAWWRGT